MQKEYEAYSTEQFLEDGFFNEWIRHRTPEAEGFWTAWMRREPANLKSMRDAEMQLRAILSAQRVKAGETEAAEVWKKVQLTLNNKSDKPYVNGNGGHWKTRPLYRRWMAAAAVVLFVVCGLWFLIGYNKMKGDSVANNAARAVQNDIAPGGNRAILTLADGRKVILDTANNGAITKQGSVTVIKLNGQLAYSKEGVSSTEVLYNTITTPKGGQYQLVLADGTKVWLNAASSLRFPTSFVGSERQVELTGEGYFEVAHNAKMPFHVQLYDGSDIQVLGTQFNINAYEDESDVRTTLLEGRVRVKKGNALSLISPGEQARTNSASDKITVKEGIDLEGVVAWKNGKFQFDKADIKTIMRQIARWYDVDVIFEGKIPDKKFNGKMYRNVNASQVLKVLEEGGIHFRIDGKKVIVGSGTTEGK